MMVDLDKRTHLRSLVCVNYHQTNLVSGYRPAYSACMFGLLPDFGSYACISTPSCCDECKNMIHWSSKSPNTHRVSRS